MLKFIRNRPFALSAIALLAVLAVLIPPRTAPAYEEISVKNGGTISGVVKWSGPRPSLPPFPVNRDIGVCAKDGKMERKSPRLIIGKGEGVANTVVYISGIYKGKRLPHRSLWYARKWIIKQCEYHPHVLIAPVRSYLAMYNKDRVLHNIRMFGAATYNLPMPEEGTLFVKPLPRVGVITVRSDAGHGWMSGIIHVTGHPYYALTDREGKFSLEDVPPGKYTVKAWHEGWKVTRVILKRGKPAFYDYEKPWEASQEVNLPPRGRAEIQFALSEKPAGVSSP